MAPVYLAADCQSVDKVEMQRCGNCNFRFWATAGGCGSVIDGFGPLVPLLMVAAQRLLN